MYELVWTALCMRRLGVSDVALAKLYRRASIPIPGLGYWASLESSQTMGRPSLPLVPDGLPDLLRIRGKESLLLTPMFEAA